jgi:hypothetical protein
VNPKLLVALAVGEAILIAVGLLLSLFVFPAPNGGLNVAIFLPVVLVSSAIVSGVVLSQTLKNRSGR